jgi:hypothetical protein
MLRIAELTAGGQVHNNFCQEKPPGTPNSTQKEKYEEADEIEEASSTDYYQVSQSADNPPQRKKDLEKELKQSREANLVLLRQLKNCRCKKKTSKNSGNLFQRISQHLKKGPGLLLAKDDTAANQMPATKAYQVNTQEIANLIATVRHLKWQKEESEKQKEELKQQMVAQQKLIKESAFWQTEASKAHVMVVHLRRAHEELKAQIRDTVSIFKLIRKDVERKRQQKGAKYIGKGSGQICDTADFKDKMCTSHHLQKEEENPTSDKTPVPLYFQDTEGRIDISDDEEKTPPQNRAVMCSEDNRRAARFHLHLDLALRKKELHNKK